jgi:hypothetical protein
MRIMRFASSGSGSMLTVPSSEVTQGFLTRIGLSSSTGRRLARCLEEAA